MWNRSLLAFTVVILSSIPAAGQMIYEVDTTIDNAFGQCTAAPNDCPLRSAVGAANNDGTDSQIILADEIYQLTIAGSNEDNNVTGDLDVTAAVEIRAAAGASPVIEQTVEDRVIDVRFGVGDVRIIGPLTITGGRLSGITESGGGIFANQNGDLELEDVVLTDNQVASQGGCLAYGGTATSNLSLHRVTLTDCHSERDGGGAWLVLSGAQATITSSRIEGNTAYRRGGGLNMTGGSGVVILDTTIRGNSAGHTTVQDGFGGGVHLVGGNFVLRQSTISDNEAGVPTSINGSGGGVYVSGTTDFLVENSTISGNRTDGANQTGAGIFLGSASSGTFDHASVVANPSQGMDGVYFLDSGGTSLTIKNSIIDDGCSGNTNSIVSSGFNVERPWDDSPNTTCNLTNPSDLQVTDLMLKPLAGYGGPTDTHALLPGSPAQLLVTSAQCQNEDQRHAVRQGLFCDSGAYDDSSIPPGQWIFADGFESGDSAAWSTAAP